MPDFLGRATELLERRFILNALLPVIIFLGAYVAVLLWATGSLLSVLGWLGSASVSAQLLATAAALSGCWFLAALLASQWRALIRLLEGYVLPTRLIRWVGARSRRARRRKRASARQR